MMAELELLHREQAKLHSGRMRAPTEASHASAGYISRSLLGTRLQLVRPVVVIALVLVEPISIVG